MRARTRTPGRGENAAKTDGESGQSLLFMALALSALIVVLAVVLDLGFAFREKSRVQASVDAAALAGVSELPDDPAAAIALAEKYLLLNGVNLDDDRYDVTITTPYNGDAGAIEVEISSSIDLPLAPLTGLGEIDVPARAVGDAEPGEGHPATDASIVSLHPTLCKSLEINSSGPFRAEGPILINSSCNSFAAEISCGTSCHAAGGIESVGGVMKDAKCVMCVVTPTSPFPDPLAGVLPPCFTSAPTPCEDVGTLPVRFGSAASPQLLKNNGFNFQPGIYYGGIEIDGSVAPWAPGIYIIAGGGLKINTSSSFNADGVMIYNTNDPTCPTCSQGNYGKIEINTSSPGSMSPPESGPYQGLLFFQDRNNTEKATYNPSSTFGEGTIYFPNAHIDLNPSANNRLQIIASTIKINNGAAFTAAYNGDTFYQAPGAPVFKLVE